MLSTHTAQLNAKNDYNPVDRMGNCNNHDLSCRFSTCYYFVKRRVSMVLSAMLRESLDGATLG